MLANHLYQTVHMKIVLTGEHVELPAEEELHAIKACCCHIQSDEPLLQLVNILLEALCTSARLLHLSLQATYATAIAL
jgi:hypothetical protein